MIFKKAFIDSKLIVNNEFDYSYSRNSNITAINEKAEGLDQSKHYSYDALQRLVSATGEARFTYDRLGNRTDHSAEYNLFNQRTTDQKYSYTYDLKGNLTGRTDKTTGETLRLSWNNSNQLVQVQKFEGSPQTLIFTLNYKYGPLKRRIETIYINEENPSNSTIRRFIYDNQNIIAETDENDKFLAFYIHGPGIDNPLAMARDINGDGEFSRDETFYYTRDHLGSIRELLDYNGKVYQRYSYSAYGETTIAKHRDKSENSFVENPYAYTSRELDHRTGFYYYRSRWYNPNTGRFLSTDLIEFEAGDSNLYRYVANNPINFIDPYGLLCIYSQSSGRLLCINDKTGAIEIDTKGGSGYGQGFGYNNPKMQSIAYIGPIPRGTYTIGPLISKKKNLGKIVFQLIPDAKTRAGSPFFNAEGNRDPDTFYVHGFGESGLYESSTGCVLVNSNDRPKLEFRVNEKFIVVE